MSTKKISLEKLDTIPGIPELIRKSKAMALLDAIIMRDWEFRYYSFDSNWGSREMMASMRNGSGDHYFIHFQENGAFIKEYDQSAILLKEYNNASILKELSKNLPTTFKDSVLEPAFEMDQISFLSWKIKGEENWKTGDTSIFSKEAVAYPVNHIAIVTGDYSDYLDWAEEYYETKIDRVTAYSIFDGDPLTNDMVRKLNPDASLEDLEEDIKEIDYPIA